MTTPNDGGPAFPVAGEFATDSTGMSLRDYFAAAVASNLVVSSAVNGLAGVYAATLTPIADRADAYKIVQDNISRERQPEQLAAQAYKLADAMLAERAKVNQ